MSDIRSPELSNPPSSREFGLEKEFPVFFWGGAKSLGDYVLISEVVIKVSDELKFPITFGVIRKVNDSREINKTFTPYNPKAGYQADERDLDLAKRKEKANAIKGNVKAGVAPFTFSAGSYAYQMKQYDLSIREGMFDRFPEEIYQLFKRLRLEVSFPSNSDEVNSQDENYRPTSRYTGEPSETFLHTGDLHISNFYPADLGPLATDTMTEIHGFYEGLYLDLPNDRKKLEAITAKIFFEPEEEQQPQEIIKEPIAPAPSYEGRGFITASPKPRAFSAGMKVE